MKPDEIRMHRLSHSLKASLKKTALFRLLLIPLVRRIRHKLESERRRMYVARLRNSTISRKEFLADLKDAIENNRGYAVGKIGYSEQHWMYYEILLKRENNSDRIKSFEKDLHFHTFNQEGVFPASLKFYLDFNKFYIQHVKNIDCLGICYRPWEKEIIRYYQLCNKFILYHCHEPFITFGHNLDNFRPEDRTGHTDEDNCYLQYFSGKKILLICPFAGFLKERATKEIFEGVWSKMGKKWFSPKNVDALEFPYGFASETQKSFDNALHLFKHITDEAEKKEFDIALIAAAGLAIPIASYLKERGKVAIDLGGHLQILFGVLGKRWLEPLFYETWSNIYYNEHWTSLPAKYRPKETDVCDNGAYW